MESFVSDGLAKSIGVSNFTKVGGRYYRNARYRGFGYRYFLSSLTRVVCEICPHTNQCVFRTKAFACAQHDTRSIAHQSATDASNTLGAPRATQVLSAGGVRSLSPRVRHRNELINAKAVHHIPLFLHNKLLRIAAAGRAGVHHGGRHDHAVGVAGGGEIAG